MKKDLDDLRDELLAAQKAASQLLKEYQRVTATGTKAEYEAARDAWQKAADKLKVIEKQSRRQS